MNGRRRLVTTEAVAAVAFLAAAVPLATLATWTRPLSRRSARHHSGRLPRGRPRHRSPWAAPGPRPTQLAFVPMLFLLPTPLVPLVVAALLWSSISGPERPPAQLSLTPSSDARSPTAPTRSARPSSSSSPATRPSRGSAGPSCSLAFGAQVVFDAGAGLARTWFAERIAPSVQLPMLWLYLTDACLSCVGLLVAAASTPTPRPRPPHPAADWSALAVLARAPATHRA